MGQPYSSYKTLLASTYSQFPQPHSSQPILFASGMPLASHIAHTKFYLPAHRQLISSGMPYGQPDSSYPILLAGIYSQILQECHWPALRLTPDDTHWPTSLNASRNSTTGLNTARANTGHIVSTTLTQCAQSEVTEILYPQATSHMQHIAEPT